MPKEEIVEGLRRAVSRGEPLEKAMASFSNAGYPREEIEEAAGILQMPGISQTQPKAQFQKPQQRIPYAQPSQTVVQRVSAYGKPPSKTETAITALLFTLLLILFGILAAVIIFKEELSDFFNNLFSRALF